MSIGAFIGRIACAVGLHGVRVSSKGHKVYCCWFRCKWTRPWKRSDLKRCMGKCCRGV